jgi:hypothetical protein
METGGINKRRSKAHNFRARKYSRLLPPCSFSHIQDAESTGVPHIQERAPAGAVSAQTIQDYLDAQKGV